MRFSLRTMLLVFLIVGLVLATLITSWKLHLAQKEVQRVREAYGLGGPNRYRLTYVDALARRAKESVGFHLIRMDSPADYAVKVFLDGVERESYPLTDEDLEFAIWRDRIGGLRFESLKGSAHSIPMSVSQQIPPEKMFYYPYSRQDSDITTGPFLVYIFCPHDLKDEPNFQWIGLDEERINAWCKKYHARSVYFKFER